MVGTALKLLRVCSTSVTCWTMSKYLVGSGTVHLRQSAVSVPATVPPESVESRPVTPCVSPFRNGSACNLPANGQAIWLQALPILNGDTKGATGRMVTDSGGTVAGTIAASTGPGSARCWLAVAFRSFPGASAGWISNSSRPAPSARESSTSATAWRASRLGCRALGRAHRDTRRGRTTRRVGEASTRAPPA